MVTRTIIGVAPGSSLYGVDAVLLDIQGVGLDLDVRLVQGVHHSYPRDLRALLLRMSAGQSVEMRQLGLLHRLLGETFALAVRQVADRAAFNLQQVLCIGCSGQSLWQESEGRYPSLVESGMTAATAERTGLTTVSDFRSRDLAAGGQAAPVEALADYLLFRHGREDRALVHLGGTAGVVCLRAGSRVQDAIGFDAGPCNLLLDGLVRQLTAGRDGCDPGGKYAVQGRCLEPLLERWLSLPFWQRKRPRCLPSQLFGEEFTAQLARQAEQQKWERHDLLCTATHLVARAIGESLRRWYPDGRPPERVLLSGGGVRNGFLWRLLESQLPASILEKTDTLGWPAEYRRAVAFALLAALTLDGVPASIPAATGAAGSRLLGSLTPGSAPNWARCLAWMAGQQAVGYRLSA